MSREPRRPVAAQRADSAARLGEPAAGEPVGASYGVHEARVGGRRGRQEGGALELQRQPGQRVGEHVVDVARQPGPFGLGDGRPLRGPALLQRGHHAASASRCWRSRRSSVPTRKKKATPASVAMVSRSVSPASSSCSHVVGQGARHEDARWPPGSGGRNGAKAATRKRPMTGPSGSSRVHDQRRGGHPGQQRHRGRRALRRARRGRRSRCRRRRRRPRPAAGGGRRGAEADRAQRGLQHHDGHDGQAERDEQAVRREGLGG